MQVFSTPDSVVLPALLPTNVLEWAAPSSSNPDCRPMAVLLSPVNGVPVIPIPA